MRPVQTTGTHSSLWHHSSKADHLHLKSYLRSSSKSPFLWNNYVSTVHTWHNLQCFNILVSIDFSLCYLISFALSLCTYLYLLPITLTLFVLTCMYYLLFCLFVSITFQFVSLCLPVSFTFNFASLCLHEYISFQSLYAYLYLSPTTLSLLLTCIYYLPVCLLSAHNTPVSLLLLPDSFFFCSLICFF